MANNNWSRRRFLRAAGYSFGLPTLTSLLPRAARAAAFPTRFAAFYVPNGTLEVQPLADNSGRMLGEAAGKEYWHVTGGGSNFELSTITQVFDPIRSDVVFFKGVQSTGRNGHGHGLKAALTGYVPSPPKGVTQPGSPDSLDQVLGDVFAKETMSRIKTLEVGIGSEAAPADDTSMARRGGNPLPVEANPNVIFAKLFGFEAPAGSPGGVAPNLEDIVRRRRSVLDGVLEELQSVKMQLSSDDRRILDQHESSVREVELSLSRLTQMQNEATAEECKRPLIDFSPLGDQAIWNTHAGLPGTLNNMAIIAPLQLKLVALGFRCGITRVATIMLLQPFSLHSWHKTVPGVSLQADQHRGISHKWHRNDNIRDQYIKIQQWRTQLFVDFALNLKSMPEGTGSVLDNTLLFHTTEVGHGSNHDWKDMPYVLAGRGGGNIKTGRALVYDDAPHPGLLLGIARALGAPLSSFGGANEPLPGLLA